MGEQTAEEFAKSNIAKMGERLGALYSALWQDITTTHFYWLEYVEVFGTKKERIELLNRAAPEFFRMVQDELWHMSLLHLARITDPAFSGSTKPNLSIQALSDHITDAKLKGDVEKAVGDALNATEFARDWRNRHIAHRDLNLVLEQSTTPLAGASRTQVNEALKALGEVLNLLEEHYLGSKTYFNLAPTHSGIDMMYALHAGVKAQEERNKRFQDGNPLAGDFDQPDI
jgi:hypothetical protein